ncbi:MAG: 5'/3'-nucleotidase SurE [Leptolinea sp.]
MIAKRKQILLTNDDSIKSPGLWAAAEALSTLGFVTIAAPREQASGMGRSNPASSDGKIITTELHIGEQVWEVFAVGGSPSQTVQHAILEIMSVKPDLVVSGINYGENVASDLTNSGTFGAALEAAALGIPALATSLQLKNVAEDYRSHSLDFDFSIAAHFTRLMAAFILEQPLPKDVDMLNMVVPHDATMATPIRVTRQSKIRYFSPYAKRLGGWDEGGELAAHIITTADDVEPGSDLYAMLKEKAVSVTPLSLDMTARVSLQELEKSLHKTVANLE